MASNTFKFPPPPPPPPPSNNYQPLEQLGAYSGSWRGRGRGRGRGYGQDAANRGSHGGQRRYNNSNEQYRQGRGDLSSSLPRGQKRRHDQAFTRHQRPYGNPDARPTTSVPSFSFDVNRSLAVPGTLATTSKGATSSAPAKERKKRMRNALGLNPYYSGEEGEKEEDADEESELSKAYQAGDAAVQISYGGRTMSLNTPEEIRAWILERKKSFPTKAKIEAAAAKANADAEERARKKANAAEERGKKVRQVKKKKDDRKAKDGATKTQRLQEELEKAQRRVAELESAQQKAQNSTEEPEADAEIKEMLVSSSSPEPDQVDHTSSSGSSSHGEPDDDGDDDDDAPAEISSKPSEASEVPQQSKVRPVCRDFARSGRCPRGRRCHFKHEPPDKRGQNPKESSGFGSGIYGGMSLLQRMRKQQEEEDMEGCLQVILYLGDNGYLDTPADNNTEEL